MSSKPITVLYVDDEEHNLVTFKATFRHEYTVLTAISGSAGLQLLNEHPVDVIVSDQRMPEMSGVEFLVQSRELAPDAVRVVLTGYSDIESVVSSINQAQVFRYLGKPWEENDLRMTITSGTENQRLARENARLLIELSEYNKRLEITVAERTEQLQQKSDELQRANKTMNQINSSLVDLNKEKSHFLELAANGIKRPAKTITETANTFLKNIAKVSPAHAQDYLERISDTARDIQDIASNLIDLNDSDNNPLVNPVLFDISMIMQVTDMTYRKAAQAKNIAIDFQRSGSVSMVRSDPQHVQTILDNLVSNAIKYSPIGSHVETIVSQHEDVFRCEVRDQGPGILDSEQHLVFQRYAKLSAVPTGGEPTIGIGLALVKNLVSALKGTIWFQNNDKGLSFFVEFPTLH